MSRLMKANRATATDLSSSVSHELSSLADNLHWQIVTAPDLTKEDKDAIWALFEKNMHELYTDSSFGWEPKAKQNELFHKVSRFILVRQRLSDQPDVLAAFTMFRFDCEDDEDVVYCYELQVDPSARRHGLGRSLMQLLQSIAQKWKLPKVMLTVFKSNVAAKQFYTQIGFEIDPTSPEYVDPQDDWVDEDAEFVSWDYEILSITVKKDAD